MGEVVGGEKECTSKVGLLFANIPEVGYKLLICEMLSNMINIRNTFFLCPCRYMAISLRSLYIWRRVYGTEMNRVNTVAGLYLLTNLDFDHHTFILYIPRYEVENTNLTTTKLFIYFFFYYLHRSIVCDRRMEWQRDKGWSHFNSIFFAVVRNPYQWQCVRWWLYKTPKNIHSKGLQWWIQLFWDVFSTRTLHYHPKFFIGEYVCVYVSEASHASYAYAYFDFRFFFFILCFFSTFIQTHSSTIFIRFRTSRRVKRTK